MANLNILGKKINKGYSRNHDQYSVLLFQKNTHIRPQKIQEFCIFQIINKLRTNKG